MTEPIALLISILLIIARTSSKVVNVFEPVYFGQSLKGAYHLMANKK